VNFLSRATGYSARIPGPGTPEAFAAALVVLVAGDPPAGLCRIDGLINPASAAALIGASLLSVLLFPAAALALRPWTRAPAPERDESVAKL